jgi:hypothetical protein
MIGLSRKLMAVSELRRLMQGSYEQKISEAGEAIRAHFTKMQGEEKPVEIVSTHSDSVVVMSEGMFHRARFETSDNGSIRVTEVAPLDVEVFDESGLDSFVQREASEVVDLFMRGSTKAALSRLGDLAPLVHRNPARDQAKVVEAVVAALGAPRPWKRFFEARGSHLKRFILDDLAELEEGRLHPKFSKLYDGTIDEGKLNGYSDLVDEDLEIVIDRLEVVKDATHSAFETAGGSLHKIDGSDIVPIYEGFATDLIDDLRAIHELGSRAAFEISDVGAKGQLRDVLAEGLHAREVASRFVVVVANRLTEAQ